MKQHFFRMRTLLRSLSILLVLAIASTWAIASNYLVVASTTSTVNSGFFDYILPIFTKETGIKVHVLSQGTGQAIRTAMNGDADVLFVHHKKSELKFVRQGYGVKRYDVMYNDFVIIGPKYDPDQVKTAQNIKIAFAYLARGRADFISRGDDSGTNKKEKELWKYAHIDPNGTSWYLSIGAGMGAALNTAAGKDAYTLSDRGTWLNFKNKSDLTIVYQNDKRLFNPYGLIAVNPKRFPHTQIKKANIFIRWFLSPRGQHYIASYKIKGKQAFFPDAR